MRLPPARHSERRSPLRRFHTITAVARLSFGPVQLPLAILLLHWYLTRRDFISHRCRRDQHQRSPWCCALRLPARERQGRCCFLWAALGTVYRSYPRDAAGGCSALGMQQCAEKMRSCRNLEQEFAKTEPSGGGRASQGRRRAECRSSRTHGRPCGFTAAQYPIPKRKPFRAPGFARISVYVVD